MERSGKADSRALGIKKILMSNTDFDAKKLVKIQPGDVTETSADTNLLQNWIDYKPNTSIKEGIHKFAKWYVSYY